jgi:hypothetical protein
MSELFLAQAVDGSGAIKNRQGYEVKSGLFEYSKTDTGTATLTFHSAWNDAALITVALATGAQIGSIEVALPARYYAKLASVAGDVLVDAQIDGD